MEVIGQKWGGSRVIGDRMSCKFFVCRAIRPDRRGEGVVNRNRFASTGVGWRSEVRSGGFG